MIKNDILVAKEDFNIKHILECGQVFRFENNITHYTLRTLDKTCILYEKADCNVIENEDKNYFENYFDLHNDYGKIKQELFDKPFMKDAIKEGSGIRILNQDPFETIVSFIISANNNIPRIKKIIEKICSYSFFPTIDTFSKFDKEFFKECGAGYRDNYLVKTADTIANGKFDIDSVKSMGTEIAAKYLCSNLCGVGPKVADCILLFGYHKMDVFPVDTWIKKVYQDIFSVQCTPQEMRKNLIATYGNLSGYAQQYLFYSKREGR